MRIASRGVCACLTTTPFSCGRRANANLSNLLCRRARCPTAATAS